MHKLFSNSSMFAIVAKMAADTPVEPASGNGEDKAPLPDLMKQKGPRKIVKPEVASVELPAEASPPPPQSTEQQPPAARIRPDYSKARAKRLQPNTVGDPEDPPSGPHEAKSRVVFRGASDTGRVRQSHVHLASPRHSGKRRRGILPAP